MANTYTQIYLHVVFAVEGRQNLIAPAHNNELQKYITGIVTGQKHKLISINNMPDHLHLLTGLRPDAVLSDLVRDVKAGSSKARHLAPALWCLTLDRMTLPLRHVFYMRYSRCLDMRFAAQDDPSFLLDAPRLTPCENLANLILLASPHYHLSQTSACHQQSQMSSLFVRGFHDQGYRLS